MSDLQCPARLLLTYAGPPGPDDPLRAGDRALLRRLADLMGGRLIAAIYSGHIAAPAAQVVGDLLDLSPHEMAGLDGLADGGLATNGAGGAGAKAGVVGEAGEAGTAAKAGDVITVSASKPANSAETYAQTMITRFANAIEEITDMHRGEAVLIFSTPGIITAAVDWLAGGRGPGPLPPGVPAEVDVDADGWRLRRWPAEPGQAAHEPGG